MRQLIRVMRIAPYIARAPFSHSAMSADLRRRAVVSSFICTPAREEAGRTFALFKRSKDVRTYPGKWAVCSGSIDQSDASPESAAQREIAEETGLHVPGDLRLLRRGKPFSLVDEALRTEWTIHPFAWELAAGAGEIRLDWEHAEVRFVRPGDLDQFDHVPLLEIGMGRVLVSEEVEEGMRVLRDDHVSGAQALAVKALEILLASVKGGSMSEKTTTEEFWREVRSMAWHLGKNGRPSMAAAIESQLFKALDVVRTKMEMFKDEGKGDLPVETVKKLTEDAITAGIAASKHTLDRLAESFVTFVKSRSLEEGKPDEKEPIRIVTLSSSGTIRECLSRLISTISPIRGISLTVLESRPNFEGVSFVNAALASLQTPPANLSISLVSDASAAMATRDADYLILGSDKVLTTGSVCNKTGSHSTAIVAKTLNPECRVIAAFDTSKITAERFEEVHAKEEDNDAREITDAWPRGEHEKLERHRKEGKKIEVRNVYFEWVPARWIDAYIAEEGVLGVEDIEKVGLRGRELEDRIFGDL